MGDLAARLEAVPLTPEPRRERPEHASGYEWDGSAGFIQTGPLTERPRTWDEFIKDAGLDPEEVEVIEPVQVRGWDAPQSGGSVVRMHYYRLTVRRRTLKADLDELIKAAKRSVSRRGKQADSGNTSAFLVALGDLQLGKMDGDGTEGTVQRFLDTTDAAVTRYKALRKQGRVGPIYLLHLGDCIEGFVSQGGANAQRTPMPLTEQVRLYRRLLFEQVKAFGAVTDRLVVAGVPGNHDEAHRPLHTYGDSWAIEGISQVRDALDFAGTYEHVTLHTPARDELTLTLDVCGTIVGLAHGHQFGRGAEGWRTWWQGQQHGRQPIGDADLLLAGHKHHLTIVQQSQRAFVQVPALESESTWFRHVAGEGGRPGIVTAIVGGGSWSSLEVL